MELTLFNVVYLITFVLVTYSVYKLLSAFFDELITNRKILIASFVMYYLIVVTLFFTVKVPAINFVVNLVCMFILTFNYRGRLFKRAIATGVTYFISFSCDLIAGTATGYVNFPVNERNDYDSVFGAVFVCLLMFTAAIISTRFKSTKKNLAIPIHYWIAIASIPIASFVILFTVLTNGEMTQAGTIIDLSLMYLINFFVFYLYEKISEFVEDEQKKQVLLEQNKHYEKQIELMDTTLKATQSIRHDIKNHIGVIYGSLSNGDTKTAMEHISSMMTVYKYKNTFITGNAAIDSVLNFKIEEAKQNGITLEAYTELPENVGLDSFDSSVILGNLLDNAFEAVSALPDNRTVKCGVRYRCGLMVIEVSNPFKGKRIKEGANYLTTKLDKKYHGIGLSNVRDIAKKYNGVLDLSEKDNVFKAAVTMYI